MSQFTITEVDPETRSWQSSKGNPYISYKVGFKGEQGEGAGELSRPAKDPRPTVGETLPEGTTLDSSNPRFPAKLVEPRSGGGSKSFGKSPQERAEIRRMASQKAAVALLAVEVAAGLTFKDEKASEMLKPRIKFFEDDAREAGEKA